MKLRTLAESVLDAYHRTFPSDVWDRDLPFYRLKPAVKDEILRRLYDFAPADLVKKVAVVGSIAGHLYNPETDVDVHIITTLTPGTPEFDRYQARAEAASHRHLPHTRRPIQFYIHEKDDDFAAVESAYDVLHDRWLKYTPLEPVNVRDYYAAFLKVVGGLDVTKAELYRNLVDYAELKRAIKDSPDADIDDVTQELEAKLAEVNAAIDKMVLCYKVVKSARTAAFLKQLARGNLTGARAASSQEDANVIYKLLERYSYTKLLSALKRFKKERGDVSHGNIRDVAQIVSRATTQSIQTKLDAKLEEARQKMELTTARRLQLVLEAFKARGGGFAVILEAWERGFISLDDWETDKDFYGRDKAGRAVGPQDVVLTPENSNVADMIKHGVRSTSLIKGDRVLLPGPIIVDRRGHVDRWLSFMQERLEDGQSLLLSCWPGFNLYSDTIPAALYSKLAADERLEADRQGEIKIVFAIDGSPLSEVLMAPQRVRPEAEGRLAAEAVPAWLEDLRGFIDEMIRNKKLIARDIGMFLKGKDYAIPGFEDYISFESRDGDAVMLLSRQPNKAAYVLRKDMRVEGGTMPWDKALTATMRKLQGEYKRVRSATGRGKLARRFGDEGEEAFDRTLTAWSREPKLRLSDWLFESGNGIRMRRDFTANKEAIREMLQAGVRFSDAVSWAETVHAAR